MIYSFYSYIIIKHLTNTSCVQPQWRVLEVRWLAQQSNPSPNQQAKMMITISSSCCSCILALKSPQGYLIFVKDVNKTHDKLRMNFTKNRDVYITS